MEGNLTTNTNICLTYVYLTAKFIFVYDWCPIFHNGHLRDTIFNNTSITATL
jgi:hypothetical protein